MFLKTYNGNVSELGLYFCIVLDEYGDKKEVELMPGGAHILVTNRNRFKYIHLMANFHLNVQIQVQSCAFLRGLSDVIDRNWLSLFNEPELQVLISGTQSPLDVDDLKQHTRYSGGYYSADKHIGRFWKILRNFSPAEQARFLRFTTSCQRSPSLGFAGLHPPFCIHKISIASDGEKLPSASTCFNILNLPTYSSKAIMREKLLYAISSGTGFEMS